jgi:hypothetical protein
MQMLWRMLSGFAIVRAVVAFCQRYEALPLVWLRRAHW